MKKIAFVGNPNVGKSAWINALSDAQFKVGNWPGVTVVKKEATVIWDEETYHLVDLPGIYALTQQGNEEDITLHYLNDEAVDLLVNVVDATNLARNLYLTLQLRRLNIPMIIIFNFMDEVRRFHIEMDPQAIARSLQVPIYAYSALDETGKLAVQAGIIKQVHQVHPYLPCICPGDQAQYDECVNLLTKRLPAYVQLSEPEIAWLAYDWMFQQPQAIKQLQAWNVELPLPEQREKEAVYGYRYIHEVLMESVQDHGGRCERTRRIDHFFLHPLYGRLILLTVMTLLMLWVFQGSAPFNDFIDFLIHDMVMKYVGAALFFLNDATKDLILHGIIAGVGGVLVFIPLMMFLYFALALLEESGYMARIACLLDHPMQHFHLSGKSFLCLLLGFGCNVPALSALRTLENEKQKKLTALLVPFMSCGARLPVYMLFAAAFFPNKKAVMVLSIYGIGILWALIVALLGNRFTGFCDQELMVMELPPYRRPAWRVMVKKVRQEVSAYVHKATGVVLWAMVILWALGYFPQGRIETSYIARFGKAVAPIYEPLGFGTRWESVAALPGAIIAKETVVGFMGQMLLQERETTANVIEPMADAKQIAFAFGSACRRFITAWIPHPIGDHNDDTLIGAIRKLWTDDKANARAYSFMVYILLSIPCIMTLQALYREVGGKLMLLSIALMLIIPYVTSLLLFQLCCLWC